MKNLFHVHSYSQTVHKMFKTHILFILKNCQIRESFLSSVIQLRKKNLDRIREKPLICEIIHLILHSVHAYSGILFFEIHLLRKICETDIDRTEEYIQEFDRIE